MGCGNLPDILKTVLHYTGYARAGGGIEAVIRNLAGAGRFQVVMGVSAGYRPMRGCSLPLRELPWMEGEKINPLNYWRARAVARAVRVWLAGDPGRVFHGHSRAGLLVGLWLRRMGEPRVVVSVHCYGRQRWFYRWAHRRLERLFWLSPAMKRHYGLVDATWGRCIPEGVPESAVTPADPVANRLRLGGIGALVSWKRWDVIIRALGLLSPEKRAQISFEHIGSGDNALLARLKKLARAEEAESAVTFRGQEDSPGRLLGEIDALIVLSENEPFSVAMLESLAAGVPVLAGDTGGAVDVIREDVNGWLYRTGDAAALARRLESWLASPPVWSAERIRATAVFIDRVAVQWDDVYASLCAGR